jgi:hypothetical protein
LLLAAYSESDYVNKGNRGVPDRIADVLQLVTQMSTALLIFGLSKSIQRAAAEECRQRESHDSLIRTTLTPSDHLMSQVEIER